MTAVAPPDAEQEWRPRFATDLRLTLGRLLGADDDPTSFEPQHPFLIDAHRRFPGLRIAATGDVFQALLGAVLEQRVEGIDAIAAWTRLVGRLGDPAPGPAPPGMRVFPDGRRGWS